MAKIKKYDDELKLASEGVKTATDNLNNMSYDNFKQGSMYQGLQKSYAQQGQQAMKDTLGQVAARTGGMASSYATSAANQSYNNYMQQLEDLARSMYNDEYSKARDKVSLAQGEYDRLYGEKRDAIADQRYDDEWTYQKDRDELTDQRYLTDKEEERVKNAAYYGNAPDYATYKANGGTLSERDYNSLVAIGEGMSADAHYEQNLTNKATKDSELKGIFGAEGFLWGDWDGDGKVGTDDSDGEVDAEGNEITFEDLYGGSSYGEDYWKGIYNDAQEKYNSKTLSENADDIEARIANGESLEAIAKQYGITDDEGWKELTGMTKAQWQKISSDNEVDGYTYKNNTEGISAIVNKLIGSHDWKLSEKDKNNFDYIFGDGAYDKIQKLMSEDRYFERLTDKSTREEVTSEVIRWAEQFPLGFPEDQIWDILEEAHPEYFKIIFSDIPQSPTPPKSITPNFQLR